MERDSDDFRFLKSVDKAWQVFSTSRPSILLLLVTITKANTKSACLGFTVPKGRRCEKGAWEPRDSNHKLCKVL